MDVVFAFNGANPTEFQQDNSPLLTEQYFPLLAPLEDSQYLTSRREELWNEHYQRLVSADCPATNVRRCFNAAFNMCSRQSFRLAHVSPSTSTYAIERELRNWIVDPDMREQTEIAVFIPRHFAIDNLEIRPLVTVFYWASLQPRQDILHAVNVGRLYVDGRYWKVCQDKLVSPCREKVKSAYERVWSLPSFSPDMSIPVVANTLQLFKSQPWRAGSCVGEPAVNASRLTDPLRERNAMINQLEHILTHPSGHNATTHNGVTILSEDRFELGRGYEGKVYLGKFQAQETDTSKYVAVKCSTRQAMFNSDEEDILLDLTRAGAPGVAAYFDHFKVKAGFAGEIPVLVQELGLTTLSRLIRSGQQLSDEEKYRIVRSMTEAVKHLHTNRKVVHRDIRPENVLIMADGSIKLTDFGLARRLPDDGQSVKTRVESFGKSCQPCEVQRARQELERTGNKDATLHITREADVFMLGMTICFAYTSILPFGDADKNISPDDAICPKVAGEHPHPPNLSHLENEPWMQHLLSRMLAHEPIERPDIDAVLRHPFFYSDDAVETLINRIHSGLIEAWEISPENQQLLTSVLQPLESLGECTRWIETWEPMFGIRFTKPQFQQEAQTGKSQHPMPKLRAFLRAYRNARTHFMSSEYVDMHQKMMLLSGGTAPGDFFRHHPSVAWFFPAVWQQRCAANRESQRRHAEAARVFEQEIQSIEQKDADLRRAFDV